MIGYIEGTLAFTGEKHIIIDVHGVGYRITMPAKMIPIIPKSDAAVKVFTHFLMNQRDGSVELFGFLRPEELHFFELLTTVSGIGPKSAQGVLSVVDLETLHMAILRGDSEALSSISGIGAKTAQRIVLELKNKIDNLPLTSQAQADFQSESQAIDALVSLGYSRFQARDALNSVDRAYTRVEEKVSAALKLLGKQA